MPTTLITGVSRGIGLAIARDLAAIGHRIVGLSRSTPEAGFDGVHIAVDLADPADTARALSRVTVDYQIDNLPAASSGTSPKIRTSPARSS